VKIVEILNADQLEAQVAGFVRIVKELLGIFGNQGLRLAKLAFDVVLEEFGDAARSARSTSAGGLLNRSAAFSWASAAPANTASKTNVRIVSL